MPEFEVIGQNVLDECGAIACQNAYGTTDPEWVGRYAVDYGDIDPSGELN